MKINLLYFASMRQIVGVDSETVTTSASTVRELFFEIQKKYHFEMQETHLKVAINEEYTNYETKLCDNDTVVFIPPVAGG